MLAKTGSPPADAAGCLCTGMRVIQSHRSALDKPTPRACGCIPLLRRGVEAGGADPGVGRRIALDQLEHLDRGAALAHFSQCLFKVAKTQLRGNRDHLIRPEWLSGPHLEFVVGSRDDA